MARRGALTLFRAKMSGGMVGTPLAIYAQNRQNRRSKIFIDASTSSSER